MSARKCQKSLLLNCWTASFSQPQSCECFFSGAWGLLRAPVLRGRLWMTGKSSFDRFTAASRDDTCQSKHTTINTASMNVHAGIAEALFSIRLQTVDAPREEPIDMYSEIKNLAKCATHSQLACAASSSSTSKLEIHLFRAAARLFG